MCSKAEFRRWSLARPGAVKHSRWAEALSEVEGERVRTVPILRVDVRQKD
jgi:hypothetical protein